MTTRTATAGWEWAGEDVEGVENCPVCESPERTILHQALSDRIFGAPGTWTVQRCNNCRVAYLDPRPTEKSIGKAYSSYYTHAPREVSEKAGRAVSVERLKIMLRNGYINKRYSHRITPAFQVGSLIVPQLLAQQSHANRQIRLLELPPQGGRLLDVGCGNGEFLLQMKEYGWEVVGLDFDPDAVKACKLAGVDAFLGTLEDANLAASSFDAITLSHVIEHVHDPVSMLKKCYQLLKAGGQLYIETPNIDSLGHAKFGKSWRGLEPPRHLVIFNVAALTFACTQAQLQVEQVHGFAATFFLYQQSMAIKEGRNPYGQDGWVPISKAMTKTLRDEEQQGLRIPQQAEIIMLKARK